MADDLAEINKQMHRFSIHEFDKGKSTWDAYIFQFEQMCRVKGLGGTGPNTTMARRDLLLAYVGSEPLEAVRNYFYPDDPNIKSFEEVKLALQTLYKPALTIFAARMEFGAAMRQDGETFTQYANRLRNLSRSCDYGNALDEQLRDRFAAGVRHTKVQVELRQKWPDGKKDANTKVSFQDVFDLALTMERAENEVQPGDSANKVQKANKSVQKPKPAKKNPEQRINWRTKPTKECSKCGRATHGQGEECPAKDAECFKCGKKGHYGKRCFQKEKQHKAVKCIDNTEAPDQLTSIRNVGQASRVRIQPKVNGQLLDMEFDTGASQSIISEQLWTKLGSPKLRPTQQLKAYGGIELDVKGQCLVEVKHGQRALELPLVVVGQRDTPLFGLPWIRAFRMQLPRGVHTVKATKDKEPKPKDERAKPVKEQQEQGAIAEDVKRLLDEWPEVFEDKLGTIRGYQATLHLRADAKPVAYSSRRVPFALKKPVEQELQRLETEGIIEKVDPATTPIEWATPTVNVDKGNGIVRICGDFRVTLNPNLIQDQHPMPCFEELTAKIAKGKCFTVIDLKDAYLQMEVAEPYRKYLIIATHKGYYRYKRLPFGVSSSPLIFQRYMDELLQGIEHTGVYLDDIIITGMTREEHIKNLRMVLQRLSRAGVRTRLAKCRFMQPSVQYLGHRIDKDGIHPTQEKVEAIKGTPTPRNVKELRAFLGAVNYHERFIPRLHAICAPLHQLTSKRRQWKWMPEHEEAFQNVKGMLSSENTVVPYDESRPLILACDASERGIGAVLFQVMQDGQERPIAYASRTLMEAEQRYAPIDREALAIIFGVGKFNTYLWGRAFTLRTDHKPLERIFGEKRDLPKVTNNRLVRWALYLNEYNYKVEYQKGSDNQCADAMSRLPLPVTTQASKEKDYIKAIYEEKVEDLALTMKSLQQATTKDEILSKVKGFVDNGWPYHMDNDKLKPYFDKRDEISVEDGIVLWSGRMVIPATLRKKMLSALHEGHPGIASMRSLARFYAWWPGMDHDIDTWVKGCYACQANRGQEAEVPLYSWNIPEKPWDRIHIDFAGPFMGKQWFVLVDAYSKWVEVIPMYDITTKRLLKELRELFARFGVPRQIVSDNGPSFTSKDFKEFCQTNGIQHLCSTPYHPKTNGLAERFVRTFKQRFLSAKDDSGDEALRLQRFLMSYRTTPHKTTGKSPAELFLGRRIQTRLDRLKPDPRRKMEKEVWKQKTYHDVKARIRSFEEGQDVWVKNELEPGWRPGVVGRKTGELSYEVNVGGQAKRKHADQLRERSGAVDETPAPTLMDTRHPAEPKEVVPQDNQEVVPQDSQEELGQQDGNRNAMAEQPGKTSVPAGEQPPLRRSTRIRNPPKRYGYDI